jgi:hypothetical protein
LGQRQEVHELMQDVTHLPAFFQPPAQIQASGGTVQDSYESCTGSLGNVAVDPVDLVKSSTNNRECELLAIASLTTIMVDITPLGHNTVMRLEIIPY